MMEIEQLWQEIDERVHLLHGEEIALGDACGRILAQEARSGIDQPPFDQSAVDGYALGVSGPYRLIGQQVAGQGKGGPLGAGEVIRILTGAVVPEGAFAVVKQEDCTVDGDWVKPARELSPAENIRRRGEVLKQGEALLAPGARITPGAIGLLAASGIPEVKVVRRARVTHLVTGDEIVPAGQPLGSGQIYDANGPMLASLIRERGIASSQFQQIHLKDSSSEISSAVARFEGDLLMISGGSGPGDRDHTIAALQAGGFQIHVSRLNSRPGKPLIFATRGAQIAFGLPGNPLSHFVCYHAFVRRVLDRLEGFPVAELFSAELVGKVSENGDGRRTWLPGVLEADKARPLPWVHSGDLSALASANALLLLGQPESAGSGRAQCEVLRLP